jgi:hypothetical protein
MGGNPEFEAAHRGETVKSPPRAPAAANQVSSPTSAPTRYGRRFLDLAATHGIQVFYLLPPAPPHVQEMRNQSGEDSENTRLAHELLDYYPGLVVIDGRHSDYPPEAFFDDVHLNALGVSALSLDVASVLDRYFQQPDCRHVWVTLPPYRAANPDSQLHKLDESVLALRAAAARRR